MSSTAADGKARYGVPNASTYRMFQTIVKAIEHVYIFVRWTESVMSNLGRR